MTDQEFLLEKYKDVPFDELTIVNGIRVLKARDHEGRPSIYVYPQSLYEIKEDYDVKAAYHAELMERYFKDSNPMTHPAADDIIKKIGIKMKARFGDD